jgi:hypothetical protein
MKHVVQRSPDGDCIVSALAMYCGVSVERVMQSVPPDVVPHGMWIPEVLHAIEKIDNTVPASTYYNGKRAIQLSQFQFPKQRIILGVLRLEAGNVWHYIFSDGEYFYDPLLPDRISLEQAKTDYHSGWSIMVTIKDS